MESEERDKNKTNKYLCKVPTSFIGTQAWYSDKPVSKDYFRPKQVPRVTRDGEIWTTKDDGGDVDGGSGTGGDVNGRLRTIDGSGQAQSNAGLLGNGSGPPKDRGEVVAEDANERLHVASILRWQRSCRRIIQHMDNTLVPQAQR